MSALLRQEQHIKGKSFIQSGDYLTALEILQNAKSQFGPHLGLLCDILCCHYCVGNVYELKNYINYILKELDIASLIISPDTQIRTLIFVSKMLEEVGSLEFALKNYKKANSLVDLLAGESQLRGRILTSAQVLRLSMLNGIEDKFLSQHYQVCYKLQTTSLKLVIELEHALMLYEVQNFSPILAQQRVVSLVQNTNAPDLQKRLIVFDYIYECLIRNINLQSTNKLFEQLDHNNFDVFEKYVYRCANNLPVNLEDCLQIKKESTLLNWLRACQLFVINSNQNDQYTLLLKKMAIEDLSVLELADQKSIRNIFNNVFSSNMPTTLILHKHKVHVSSQSFDLKTNGFSLKVLKYFSMCNQSSIELFVKSVYEANYNETYYERVRIALNRFNKELLSIVGVEKVISIKKVQGNYLLQLSSLVNIQEVVE